jgi:nucleotide-binding universal stress UspA family protein
VKTEILHTPSVVAPIVDCADKEKSDLIGIGIRVRSGVSEMLLGSVASGVVTY